MDTERNDRLILVPCDFSPLAYHAMEHGAFMSKPMNCRLIILHVAVNEKEMYLKEKKMRYVADECFDKFGVRPEVMVRKGEQPYSVIKDIANELKPVLVILKSAGGVHTIKILAGTSTPFLVIQKPPGSEMLENISFPINFLNQHDEKLRRVVHFNDYYPDAFVHIITPSGKGTEKERIITSNLGLLARVMNEQGIKNNFITHDKNRNTAETILELSRGADMIVIQIEQVTSIQKFFFGLREEKLIVNPDKIPVLCFNSEKDFI